MTNQEKLLKEIKSLSDSIRLKNRALKSGISEREKFLETTFKPVTAPLKQIAQNIGKPAISFEGDVILPISKYEKEEEEEFQGDKAYRKLQTTTEEETEESEESEESEETEGLREKEYTSKSEEEEGSTSPSNLSKLGSDIVLKGTLGRKYLLKMLHSAQPSRKYHTYGARIEDNGLMIGDSRLDIDAKDNILIGNNNYKGTTGLFELIFKNKPVRYTKKDLAVFKDILETTNAHKKGYSKDLPVYRNRSVKYVNIISDLFPSQVKKGQIKRRALSSAELNVLHKKRRTTNPTSSGKGLLKNLYKTNIIYYNDINKLVDRMRLIHEAMEAGHTGLNNEWVALVDELRSRGVIG